MMVSPGQPDRLTESTQEEPMDLGQMLNRSKDFDPDQPMTVTVTAAQWGLLSSVNGSMLSAVAEHAAQSNDPFAAMIVDMVSKTVSTYLKELSVALLTQSSPSMVELLQLPDRVAPTTEQTVTLRAGTLVGLYNGLYSAAAIIGAPDHALDSPNKERIVELLNARDAFAASVSTVTALYSEEN